MIMRILLVVWLVFFDYEGLAQAQKVTTSLPRPTMMARTVGRPQILRKIGPFVEDAGVFLRVDDHRPLKLPVLKNPSALNGCNNHTKLILGVLTRPSEWQYRNFIRKTWGAAAYRNCDTTKIIFLLGRADEASTDQEVLKEATRFEDVLLLDYHESYQNVSRKIFGFFRYVYDHCPNIKCTIKIDGDTVGNINGLEELCDSMSENKHFISGRIVRFTVNRTPGGKHYVPFFVYPDGLWPTFIGGFTYMLSGVGIIPRVLFTLQKKTPYFTSENFRRFAEDIIFGGFVAEKAGIPLRTQDGLMCCNRFNFWNVGNRSILLSVEARGTNPFFILTQIAANRRRFYPEISSDQCYKQSFGHTPNGTVSTLSQQAQLFNPMTPRFVPKIQVPVVSKAIHPTEIRHVRPILTHSSSFTHKPTFVTQKPTSRLTTRPILRLKTTPGPHNQSTIVSRPVSHVLPSKTTTKMASNSTSTTRIPSKIASTSTPTTKMVHNKTPKTSKTSTTTPKMAQSSTSTSSPISTTKIFHQMSKNSSHIQQVVVVKEERMPNNDLRQHVAVIVIPKDKNGTIVDEE